MAVASGKRHESKRKQSPRYPYPAERDRVVNHVSLHKISSGLPCMYRTSPVLLLRFPNVSFTPQLARNIPDKRIVAVSKCLYQATSFLESSKPSWKAKTQPFHHFVLHRFRRSSPSPVLVRHTARARTKRREKCGSRTRRYFFFFTTNFLQWDSRKKEKQILENY